MSKLTKFQDAAVKNTANVKGGTSNNCAPKSTYCAPKLPTVHVPAPPTVHIPAPPAVHVPAVPTVHIPAVPTPSFGHGCW